MSKTRSTTLYATPFSKGYWRDAAAELKDTKMLVVTALMVALRIALKPLAIPLGPQLSIQTAMLATALGAMIYGPVIAIPAAIISDTVGFLLFPTGDYFVGFMLTEIASTLVYALCLYRAKITTTRVTLCRFFICFLVNVVLQQFVFAWYYVYIGNPEKARDQILGIMTVARIFKNLCMFPIESVVLTLFLRFMMPVTRRAGLTYSSDEDMKYTIRQVVILVALVAVGVASAVGFLFYHYDTTSLSASYSAEERYEHNTDMIGYVQEDYAGETLVTTVESAYKPFLGKEVTYTVAVYTVDEEALAGYEKDLETIRGLSKSKAKAVAEDGVMTRVATVTIVVNDKTGELISKNYSK